MESGKPQKQALAIAYAIKRRNQKKMAAGGMVNEDLNPEHDNPDALGTQDVDREALSLGEQEHGELPQPEEPRRHVSPSRDPIHAAPRMGQADLSLEEQGADMAYGGMMKKAIARRMAQGGMVDSSDRPEDGDSIDNFLSAEHPDNDFLSGEEQTPYHHLGDHSEEAEEPRKGIIRSIMRNLHSKHFGR